MNRKSPRSVMEEVVGVNDCQRRRSPRLSSPPQGETVTKMALGSAVVKRSITVRKIAPRKTVTHTEHDKENTPSRGQSEQVQLKKQKVSTPTSGPDPDRGRPSSGKKKKKAAMPSPILPSSPPPPPPSSSQFTVHPEDAVWSQKVRRSYTRVGEKSFHSPDSRDTLFGFEKLKTPEVVRGPKPALEVSGSMNSFASLLEAEDCGPTGFPEQDPNIPGVTLVKEKRRRPKVQQLNSLEMDELAARMNAEFEKAEEFELFVE
ncbi:sororin [Gouania willdenowi]|uniref:sororin n=1 Tax=Gouania willdenowi TaxID=441366 RepID=UPI00105588D0|nr:sororin [Gouania willdenowi]